MLGGTKVLDLTDDRGHLAGMLLAHLGADVLLVEPPEGHRSRHRGPYVDDIVGPERSLEFLVFNRGKRSTVLHDPAQTWHSAAVNTAGAGVVRRLHPVPANGAARLDRLRDGRV